MIYLCSVYSYKADASLMQKRFEYVEEFVAENFDWPLFSPIVYTHSVGVKYGLPKTYDFWKKRDRHFIELASEVWVLKMPSWEFSEGVTDEIEYAKSIGKHVHFIDVADGDYDE